MTNPFADAPVLDQPQVKKVHDEVRGEYCEWQRAEYTLCPKCRCSSVRYRERDLSDGTSEMRDGQFRCTYCQHVWPDHGSAD